jgi:hypothetical protein
VYGLSPEESRDLILSVGTGRSVRPLSPIEVADLLHRAKQAGASSAGLSDALHLQGPTMIGRFMSLNRLTPAVRIAVDWGASRITLGFVSAVEIARLPMDDQVAAAQAALAYRMTRTEMKELAQLRIRSRRPIEECITEIVGMRPRLEIVSVFLGQITSEDLRSRLALMTQRQRDEVLQGVLGNAMPAFRDRLDARLGDVSFILAGDDAAAAAIQSTFADLEEELTILIAEVVK